MPDERIMVMLLGKSALFIGFGNGRSHGADSLDFDSSPSGSRSYLVTNFSTSAAVIFVVTVHERKASGGSFFRFVFPALLSGLLSLCFI